MIKGVVFDVDGTLLASNDAHAHSWVDAFSEFGYSVPFYQLRWLIGMGGDKVLKTLFPGMTDEQGIGKVIAHRRGTVFLERYAPSLQPTPGARALVEEVHRRGLKTVVATSSKKREFEILLKLAQVDDLLTRATTATDVNESKPAPDVVHQALDLIDLDADEVIMVGDTPYDVEAAQRAEVTIIGVRSGGWNDDALEGAAAIYDHPADLLGHFDESLLGKESI